MAPATIFLTPFLLVAAVLNRFKRNAGSTPCLPLPALTCSMSSGISGMIPELFWGKRSERNLGVWLLWPGFFVRSARTEHTDAKKREVQLRLTF